jgi:hypothetical protein
MKLLRSQKAAEKAQGIKKLSVNASFIIWIYGPLFQNFREFLPVVMSVEELKAVFNLIKYVFEVPNEPAVQISLLCLLLMYRKEPHCLLNFEKYHIKIPKCERQKASSVLKCLIHKWEVWFLLWKLLNSTRCLPTSHERANLWRWIKSLFAHFFIHLSWSPRPYNIMTHNSWWLCTKKTGGWMEKKDVKINGQGLWWC